MGAGVTPSDALIVGARSALDTPAGRISLRFGDAGLLARTAAEVAALAGHTVVLPVLEAPSARIQSQNFSGVTVGPVIPESTVSLGALGEGLALLPKTADAVAVISAEYPYLSGDWLRSLLGALQEGADGVYTAQGSHAHPLLGVYRADALRRATVESPGENFSDWVADARMSTLQAPPACNGSATVATRLESPEDYRRALGHLGYCDPSHAAVTLELVGNLRVRTGCALLPIHGDTIGTACAVLRRVVPETERLLPGEDELTRHFRFAINGGEVTNDLAHPLRDGDQLMLFSATVGG